MNVPMGDLTYTDTPSHKVGVFTMSEEPNINVENSLPLFDVWAFVQYALVKRIAKCVFSEAMPDSLMVNRS